MSRGGPPGACALQISRPWQHPQCRAASCHVPAAVLNRDPEPYVVVATPLPPAAAGVEPATHVDQASRYRTHSPRGMEGAAAQGESLTIHSWTAHPSTRRAGRLPEQRPDRAKHRGHREAPLLGPVAVVGLSVLPGPLEERGVQGLPPQVCARACVHTHTHSHTHTHTHTHTRARAYTLEPDHIKRIQAT